MLENTFQGHNDFGMPAAMSVHRSELGNSMPMHNDFGMPAAMGVYRDSLRPILPYVDPGRTKFLEIQKMEWEYQPPSATKLPFKGDFDWFKPTTPIEPIIPKPIKLPEPIKLFEHELYKKPYEPYKIPIPEPLKYHTYEPVKPIEIPIYENPYLKTLPTNFAFQPIKIENDLFPKRGGMHDSFNVTRSGDIFNGHTTIELKGGLKTRLGW